MSHQVHEILHCQVHRSTRRAIAFCLLLIGSQGVHAQMLFRPFSADQIQTLNKQTRSRKVCAIDKAMRFEGEHNGRKVITIIRYDRRESLGSEQVGPYHGDKARLRVTYEGQMYTSVEWGGKELDGFVVKRQDEKGQWTSEYRNIRLGSQDPSLFEIPAGYQKLNRGEVQPPRS